MTERQLQTAVAKVLDASGLLWCHVPNGGQRNAIVGKMLKAEGVKKGVPDVLIFQPKARYVIPLVYEFSGLALELKVGRNKPSPEQLQWHERLRECGWRVEVCYTLDAVLYILRECYPSKFP